MALNPSTLADGIKALEPTTDEAVAIQKIVDAWDAYFAESTVNAITATPGSYSAGLSAMQSAMVGISSEDAGATAIQSGVTAFWVAIAALPTSIWVTAPIVLVPPIVPPPGIGGTAAALEAVFSSNASGNLSLDDAATAIASALHTAAGLGAIVPGSILPAPPAPLPIL